MQPSTLTLISVKRIHGKAILTLSDGEVLYMPRVMLRERPYRSGAPFDAAAHRRFIEDRAYPFALNKAVSLLAARARTEHEIAQALRMNAYPETAIARTMARLHESGYIDDHSFAEQWAASKTNKRIGSQRIRMQLKQKGVPTETIDSVISAIDQDDLLASALQAAQKASRGKNLSLPADRQKVLAALARRGYEYALARDAIEQLMTES